MSEAESQAYASGVKALRVEEIGFYVSITIVFYDYILCVFDEANVIWKKNYSLSTGLYVMLRYLGLLYSILMTLTYTFQAVTMSPQACYATFVTYDVLLVVIIFVLQGTMILRLYALYKKSKRVLSLLSGAFVAEQVMNVILMVNEYRVVSATEESLLGSHICEMSTPIASWIPVSNDVVILAFHTIVAALTLYHLLIYLRERQLSLSLRDLLSSVDLRIILIRDNILCYLIVALPFITRIVIITAKLTTLTSIVDAVVINTISQTLLTAVVGPRIILNINSQSLRTQIAREYDPLTGRFRYNDEFSMVDSRDTASKWA